MTFISAALVSIVAAFSGFFAFLHPAVSYIAAIEVPQPRATVLFGGDMMFDRSIRKAAEAQGGDFIFSCLDPVLSGADMVVANLEGPITEHASVSIGSKPGDDRNYTFTFPTSTAALLYAHNIKMVNLGNNHILNFKAEGAQATMESLERAGVQFFGDPLNASMASGSIHGVSLSFINYNQFVTVRGGNASSTIAQIRRAREQGSIPIVYTHWGDEYVPANELQKTLARRFIDAGAEMVIGSHPHVIQEHEIYNGKHIYYSLGNLIFDQYWNEDVRTGLLLSVTFGEHGVERVEERRVVLERDRRTCPAEYSH